MLKKCFVLAVLCLWAVSQLAAQMATATILGTVTDTSGAAISDVAIQVKNLDRRSWYFGSKEADDAQSLAFDIPDLAAPP